MAALAAAQRGAVSRVQLLACGLTRHQIATRVRRCQLHRVYRGVYIVGHTALPSFALEYAALLACGEGAVLSHGSAAHVWSLLPERPDDPHVTQVGHHPRRRAGIRTHLVEAIEPRCIRVRAGMRLTSPARTLVDLAAVVDFATLERALSEARVRRLVSPAELERELAASKGRRGVATLRALIDRESGPEITRSEAERRVLRLIRAARLPLPQTNVRLAGYEVDLFWPEQRLVVEIDGYAYHGHRQAFERDRERDAALVAAGFRVIRITWRQLIEQPLRVAAILACALVS